MLPLNFGDIYPAVGFSYSFSDLDEDNDTRVVEVWHEL